MPHDTRLPPPRNPRTAVYRFLMLESAQAREQDAIYLAQEVETRLAELKMMHVVQKGAPEDVRARMLAAHLRQAAVYDRLDWQNRQVARDVCAFLDLWDLYAAIPM
jgi:hypothetical protein